MTWLILGVIVRGLGGGAGRRARPASLAGDERLQPGHGARRADRHARRSGTAVPHRPGTGVRGRRRADQHPHAAHVDVPARRLGAHPRERALLLGVRQQRRGQHGTRALPGLLSLCGLVAAARTCSSIRRRRCRRSARRERSRACSGRTWCSIRRCAVQHALHLRDLLQGLPDPGVGRAALVVRHAGRGRRAAADAAATRTCRAAWRSGRTSADSSPAMLLIKLFVNPRARGQRNGFGASAVDVER